MSRPSVCRTSSTRTRAAQLTLHGTQRARLLIKQSQISDHDTFLAQSTTLSPLAASWCRLQQMVWLGLVLLGPCFTPSSASSIVMCLLPHPLCPLSPPGFAFFVRCLSFFCCLCFAFRYSSFRRHLLTRRRSCRLFHANTTERLLFQKKKPSRCHHACALLVAQRKHVPATA